MTQRSALGRSARPTKSRPRTNRMLRPSGLHAGLPSQSALRVSRRFPVPSAFITQTSVPAVPGPISRPAEWTYASRRPLGDQAGSKSPDVRVALVSVWRPVPSSLTETIVGPQPELARPRADSTYATRPFLPGKAPSAEADQRRAASSPNAAD